MKRRKRVGVVLAVLGALIALGVGVFVYLQAEEAAQIARQTPTQNVVIALADLPERMPVPAAGVSITKVPAGVVPADAATKLADVVGKYPLTRIYRNEVVVQAKLADTAGKTGPSFVLKDGMVAVTLAGNDLLTPTGAVRPGDRVDMLLSLPLPKVAASAGQGSQSSGAGSGASIPIVSQTLLQNIEVLRIGPFPAAGQPETAGGKGITFQVSHQDALIIKWAKDSGGVIDFVLRHPSDREPIGTDAVTANFIFRKFRFELAEPIQ